MLFKKINPLLEKALNKQEIKQLTPLQEKIIPLFKSGANLLVIAPSNTGKTTSLLMGVIQKLKAKAVGDNPKVLIYVKDKESAMTLEEKFKPLLKQTDLRLYTVIEEHHIYNQKDNIYIGTDIVIATPKRLNKLYFQNGINLNELNTIIVEDANFLKNNSFITDINRVVQSAPKTQRIVFAEKEGAEIQRAKDLFLEPVREVTFLQKDSELS